MLTANTTNRGNSKKNNKRTNKLETLKFVGGTKLMKELQKTLFFAAYDTVVSSGNSITEKRQKELLAEAIIGNGNPDVMTLTEQMATGINQFAHLYENIDVPINDDKNASSSSGNNNGTLSPTKILKECYFPQTSNGGKISIYANVPNGITKGLLCAKSMNNPVDISTVTMMRGAKEVLRNGRKALACATDSDSDFKDGKLPSGRTLADYQKYIRQSMFVKLKGKSDSSTNCGTRAGGHADSAGGDDDDDDLESTNFADEKSHNNDEDDEDFYSDPDNMPADYSFTGMIAFFMWGFIVDDRVDEVYKSRQFQINDSILPNNVSNSTTSRKQIKKEAAIVKSRERDAGAGTTVASPFRRGMTITQQIEVAKLETAKFLEERRLFDNEFSQEMTNIQTDIDNRIKLARLWGVTDRQDPIFLEIQQLMDRKKEISLSFRNSQEDFNTKQQRTDDFMQQAFIAPTPSNKRFRQSSIMTPGDDGTSLASSSCTPSSSIRPPRSLVLFGAGAPTRNTAEGGSTMMVNEGCLVQQLNSHDNDNAKNDNNDSDDDDN